MLTTDQQQGLIDNCTRTWTTRNGVNGTLVTGPNGNTLFLPAAGYRGSDPLNYAGSYGYYWSRTHNSGYGAYYLGFYSGRWYWASNSRFSGLAVRAVRVAQ